MSPPPSNPGQFSMGLRSSACLAGFPSRAGQGSLPLSSPAFSLLPQCLSQAQPCLIPAWEAPGAQRPEDPKVQAQMRVGPEGHDQHEECWCGAAGGEGIGGEEAAPSPTLLSGLSQGAGGDGTPSSPVS